MAGINIIYSFKQDLYISGGRLKIYKTIALI